MTEPAGTTTYTYDALYRLTGASYPTSAPAAVSYTYDPMGNRLTMTEDSVVTSYSYDDADRLTAITTGSTSVPLTWDNNGQMLSKGDQTFSWDVAGRMIALNNGATTASYIYNGDGVRVGRVVDGTATSYLQDLAFGLPQVLVETSGADTTRYVLGLDQIAQVGATTSYYHGDALGSVRAMSDSAGQATATYVYDVFGTVRTQTGGTGNAYTFTGEQADSEAGLVFLRARYYDPAVGRFISRDIFSGKPGWAITMNRYVYAANQPINQTDASGMDFDQLQKASQVWGDVWQQFTALGEIVGGSLTGDPSAQQALRFGAEDITSGAVIQRLPEAARRVGESIDLPAGMQSIAQDSYEAANEFERNGDLVMAWTLRTLGGATDVGSMSVDVLWAISPLSPLRTTRSRLEEVEMYVGAATGQRSYEQALTTFAKQRILPGITKYYYADACAYSTSSCAQLQDAILSRDPLYHLIEGGAGRALDAWMSLTGRSSRTSRVYGDNPYRWSEPQSGGK